MSANSNDIGEVALMRRLALAFADRLSDEYLILMCWLIYAEN